MNPIVTEQELKSLKLFSYYLRSYGIKSGHIDVWLDYGGIDGHSDVIGFGGGSAELYDSIWEVLKNIITNNDFSDYLDNTENYARVVFNIDCVERTLEAELWETVYDTNSMTGDSEIDSMDDEYKEEFEKLFKVMKEKQTSVIRIAFNGGGDSGEIDRVSTDGIEIPDFIMDYLYDFLESFYGGWEINEGSYGDFVIDSKDRMIYLEFNENTQEEQEHDFDFQIKF